MATGLSVSDVVNVSVTLAPSAAVYRNFGNMMILGSTDVISTSQRRRAYTGLDGIAQDFGTNSPEYLSATLFFSQVPQPSFCWVGRWAQVATKGRLEGAVLSPSQQLISNFTAVPSGAMELEIDNVPTSLTGISLSSVTNLNGVASAVQTALQAKVAGVTCVWDGVNKQFVIKSATTGIASKISGAQGPTATGSITFAANPLANATVTLNSVAITFVAAAPTGNQVLIGVDLPTTLTNLVTFLTASVNGSLTVANYRNDATKLYIEYGTTGTGGNSYTLAASVATVSGATLSGGTGTDIAVLMGLSVAGFVATTGIAAETLTSCISTMSDAFTDWYGITVATATAPSDSDLVAASQYIEGSSLSRIMAQTTQSAASLDSTTSVDLGASLKTLLLNRSFTQYSTSSPYAAASILGRIATIDFEGSNTTLTVKFKQEPGIAAETLTETNAITLKSKNINAFVNYINNTAILQEGVMASGMFIDERHGADWLQNYLQTNVYNALYQSTTKIPQTDDGIHILVTVCEKSMETAVTNGLVAPGVWTGPPIGQLKTGDTLTSGYYVYVPRVATQTDADRALRKAPPIQIAAKLAGAVHSANVLVTLNR